jgi:hypothetical protein
MGADLMNQNNNIFDNLIKNNNEKIDKKAMECFEYYGIKEVNVIK